MLLELVCEAEGEGKLWADDGEVGLLAHDDAEHVGEGGLVHGDAARELRDAAVAGGTDDLLDAGGAAERPDDGGFAAAGADDQNFHG